jgi:hypothetical protein
VLTTGLRQQIICERWQKPASTSDDWRIALRARRDVERI